MTSLLAKIAMAYVRIQFHRCMEVVATNYISDSGIMTVVSCFLNSLSFALIMIHLVPLDMLLYLYLPPDWF